MMNRFAENVKKPKTQQQTKIPSDSGGTKAKSGMLDLRDPAEPCFWLTTAR
jgi:hypothetical protein